MLQLKVFSATMARIAKHIIPQSEKLTATQEEHLEQARSTSVVATWQAQDKPLDVEVSWTLALPPTQPTFIFIVTGFSQCSMETLERALRIVGLVGLVAVLNTTQTGGGAVDLAHWEKGD